MERVTPTLGEMRHVKIIERSQAFVDALSMNPENILAKEYLAAHTLFLEDFYQALSEAVKNGIVYNEKILSQGWEFIFSSPKIDGGLPVVIHACFIGK